MKTKLGAISSSGTYRLVSVVDPFYFDHCILTRCFLRMIYLSIYIDKRRELSKIPNTKYPTVKGACK